MEIFTNETTKSLASDNGQILATETTHYKDAKLFKSTGNNSDTNGYYDKEYLLRLARKKVKEKKNLLRHIIIYTIACPSLLLLWAGFLDMYFDTSFGFFLLGALCTWGIFIVSRAISLCLPHIKDLAHLKHSKRDSVEIEYERLKKMEPDKIAVEYERL